MFTKFETVIETIFLNLHLKFELKVATFGLDALVGLSLRQVRCCLILLSIATY